MNYPSQNLDISTIAEIERYAEIHELTCDYVIAEFVIDGYFIQVWPK